MSNNDVVIDGAKSLDALVGKIDWLTEDWRDRIDLDSLNMASLSKCVLGQLHPRNDYDEAVYDIRKVEDDFDTYPFGLYTEEWVEYLRESSVFSKGSKWVSAHDSTYTMTIQGSVEIEGRGKQYVYLTSEGGVYVHGADLIQGRWKPMEKMPKFEFGQQIVFPHHPNNGDEFYYLDSKDADGNNVLRLGKNTLVVLRLKELTAIYGNPKVGNGNRSHHLGMLKKAMSDN